MGCGVIKIILGAIAGVVFLYFCTAFIQWQFPVDFGVMSGYARATFVAELILVVIIGGGVGSFLND